MSDHPGNADDAAPTTGVVEQLARDDVERKRFLKMAGKRMGAGAAATGLAEFIAACGSSWKSATASTAQAAAPSSSSSSSMGSQTSSAAASTGDLAIVNYALTLGYP